MALSGREFDPSMRWPVISEVQPPFPSSGVIFVKDSCLSQAFHMGETSGVTITKEEADRYKYLRERPGSLKSDQVLMAEDVLPEEKRNPFMQAFPQIFRHN